MFCSYPPAIEYRALAGFLFMTMIILNGLVAIIVVGILLGTLNLNKEQDK